MSQPRVIRKYVNRRLYDTQESRYVNLEELRRLIVEGEEIRVVERTTGNDITTSILLQIIGESQRDNVLLQSGFLCKIIRLGASTLTDPGLPQRLNAALQQAVSSPVPPPPAPSQPGEYFGGS
jgi:polyhydroxyalkanoate synthesis repressor PhaR